MKPYNMNLPTAAAWGRHCLFLSFCLLHFTRAQVLNPISIPIIKGGLDVHIAPFVQIPKVNGEVAEILCMVPRGRNLYVGTQSQIFKVNRRRQVSLWFDVGKALQEVPGFQGFVTIGNQGGLRSVAFPPSFTRTGYFYTSQVELRVLDRDGHHFLRFFPRRLRNRVVEESVVSEWRYDNTTKTISSSSHREIFRIGLRQRAHAMKQMTFRGARLFIAHGDSSDQPATLGGGQNPDGLGKILCIKPRRRGGPGRIPYQIPRSNPFRTIRNSPALGDRQKMIKEVWALGFRNPHNLCFSKNGTLFAVDIGRGNIEEVNIVKKGMNYGWPEREGTFVHFRTEAGGEIIEGIGPLPPNDANKENRVFEYPVAQLGHEAVTGSTFVFQAIAGSCPVENGSPVSGHYFYADFPRSGRLFFSRLDEMFKARTKGRPDQLTQARVREANIFFDHDRNRDTPAIRVRNLQDIVLMDPAVIATETAGRSNTRADVRFGRGGRGELYWSSKTNGMVYVMSSSFVGGPGGVSG